MQLFTIAFSCRKKDGLFGVLPEGLPHEFDKYENYIPSVLMTLQSRLYELNGLEVGVAMAWLQSVIRDCQSQQGVLGFTNSRSYEISVED